MIRLDKHIEILLLEHDCVIVPGFGGFVSHHVDAHWDSNDNMFLPPSRTLGFNNQLTLNDSLLAQSYVDTYDMSYPEALKEIDKEVSELKHTIDFEGAFELHGLGILYRNATGGYRFEPNESGILTPALYGLSGFEISPLGSKKTEMKTVDTAHTQQKTISIKLSTLRKAAVACIAALVLWMLPSPILNSDSPNLKGGINTEILYKMMPKSMTTGKPEIKTHVEKPHSHKKAQPVRNSIAVKKQQPQLKVEGHWTIVLACGLPETNATTYMKELTQQGIDGVQVILSGNKSKVVRGEYNSREEASAGLKALQAKSPKVVGWITNLE